MFCLCGGAGRSRTSLNWLGCVCVWSKSRSALFVLHVAPDNKNHKRIVKHANVKLFNCTSANKICVLFYTYENKCLIVQQNLANHQQNIKISFLTNIFCWQHRLAVSEAVNNITCRRQCEEQLAGLADAVSKKV